MTDPRAFPDEQREVQLRYKNPLREEYHPELSPDFQYKQEHTIFTFRETGAPWHWHRELELFYIEKGTLEYRTPDQTLSFSEGTGGLVNTSVLHRTSLQKECSYVSQKLHIFAPEFLGEKETRIYQRYISPVMRSQIPLFCFRGQENDLVQQVEMIDSSEPGYELRLRNLLSEVLLCCYQKMEEQTEMAEQYKPDEKMLGMMAFVEDHIQEKLSVKEIAASVYISERDCYRKFQKELGETPFQFIQSLRIERACQLLRATELPVGEVAELCGMGASSYFSAVFVRRMGCTPGQYRRQKENRE